MNVYLEHRDRTVHQFWRIELDGENRTITTGKVGAKTAPKPKSKAFKSAEDAIKSALKEIASKKADYWFDPSDLTSVLESHAEFLAIPKEEEVEAHRSEAPYAPDAYFDVFRSGALSIGDFNDFGPMDEKLDGEFSDLPAVYGAYSAEDLLDEEGAKLDPYFYIVGTLYDGSAVVMYNQGQYAGRLGVMDHGPAFELVEYLVEGDPDATIDAWIKAGLAEPVSELTLEAYLLSRILHHKGAAVEETRALREALAVLSDLIAGDAEAITELDLTAKGLKVLPDFVGECVNLTKLILRENEFETVPEVVRCFGKLEVLDLYYNPLDSSALPDWLSALPLKELNLGITSPEGPLSEVIPKLPNLEVLCLYKTHGLPSSIGQLSKLRSLDLCLEGAIEPAALRGLQALEELSLDRIDTPLPAEIGELRSLRVLTFDVPRNLAFELPASIANLKSLTHLKVGPASLPNTLGELSSLTHLQTSAESLPESLSNLTELRELDLQYARTSSLPESIGNLTKLELLNLSSSSVERLPASFANLSSLRELKLATAVPEGTVVGDLLCGLGNLEFLSLYWHVLKNMKGDFSGMKKLETLKVFSSGKLDGDFLELMAFVHDLPNLKNLGVPYEFRSHFQETLPNINFT